MVLVPQRFAAAQRVLDALERLAFAAQLQERLALEIEQIVLGDDRAMGEGAAGQDPCERAADHGVVIADSSGPPGQMNPELERGLYPFAADRNLAADRRPVALAHPGQRQRL